MAFTILPDVDTGDVIPASYGDAIKANFAETAPAKVTTAEDMIVGAGPNTLKRVAKGSDGHVWTIVAGVLAWAALPENLQWLIHLDARLGGDAHVNWNTITGTSGAQPEYLESSGAQNAEVTFNNIGLGAGTWKLLANCVGNSSSGIVSVQFDGVEKGTIDLYTTASPFGNILGAVSGIVVPTSARIALKLKMATKNASSGGYTGRVGAIELRRTA